MSRLHCLPASLEMNVLVGEIFDELVVRRRRRARTADAPLRAQYHAPRRVVAADGGGHRVKKRHDAVSPSASDSEVDPRINRADLGQRPDFRSREEHRKRDGHDEGVGDVIGRAPRDHRVLEAFRSAGELGKVAGQEWRTMRSEGGVPDPLPHSHVGALFEVLRQVSVQLMHL